MKRIALTEAHLIGGPADGMNFTLCPGPAAIVPTIFTVADRPDETITPLDASMDLPSSCEPRVREIGDYHVINGSQRVIERDGRRVLQVRYLHVGLINESGR